MIKQKLHMDWTRKKALSFFTEISRKKLEKLSDEELFQKGVDEGFWEEGCCVCKKEIKSDTPFVCNNCEGEHHEECSGESSEGIGEYPDEDAYSICKKCLNKINATKLDSHGKPKEI